MKQFLLFIFALALVLPLAGQGAIRWTVTVNTQQITQSDRSLLGTLEQDLTLFLNTTPWTEDVFREDERIEASMILILQEIERETAAGTEIVPGQYTGTLSLQTSRPIYGTGEITPIINFQDEKLQFSYQQYEAIQYSETAFATELASVMAFYANLVLGFDYDTFSPLGGLKFFRKAQEIYNQLPSAVANQSGWVANRSRNRFFLLENVLEPRMLPLRRAYYNYHRTGLDLMTTDPLQARNNITLAIEDAQLANQNYPGTVYMQNFVDAKREEIIEIYKGATGPEQNAVIQAMSRIDPSQSGEYRSIRYTSPSRSRSRAVPTSRTNASRPGARPFGRQ